MRTIFSHSAAIATFAFSMTGCTAMTMGTLADVLAGGVTGSSVSGEVRSIDTRRQEIQLTTGWSGSERIRYDNRTQVIYQQRRYNVRDLGVGDYVQVQLGQSRDRDRRYATTIRIREDARQGRGNSPGNSRGNRRIEQLDGTIRQIDQRQGWFEVDDRYGSRVTVTLPYQANRGLTDRFQRLRRGNRVRLEGERLNANRMEVHRFF